MRNAAFTMGAAQTAPRWRRSECINRRVTAGLTEFAECRGGESPFLLLMVSLITHETAEGGDLSASVCQRMLI